MAGPYTVFSSGKDPSINITEIDLDDESLTSQYNAEEAAPFALFDFTAQDFELDNTLDELEAHLPLDQHSGHYSDSFLKAASGKNTVDIHNQITDHPANFSPPSALDFAQYDVYDTHITIPDYTPPRVTAFSSGSPYLPLDVRFLLSHYTTHVIDSLSAVPLPQDRAPWRGLHLSCALTAYGELDVLGTSSLARVSLLYSLLALTCFHLSSMYASDGAVTEDLGDMPKGHDSPTSQHWLEQARKYRSISRTAFRKHLEVVAAQPSQKQKYKEFFMAALSLVCVGIVSGDVWDSRLYILQCENIIRTLGASKRRFSKKALQLHRIFAFVSILEKTTFCQSKEQYSGLLESQDFLPNEVNLVTGGDSHEKDMLTLADCGAGRRLATSELRLDLPEDKLFDNLYGIPGAIFDMLSTTNTLIEKIGARTARGTAQYMIPMDLLTEAACLEQAICNCNVDAGVSKFSLDVFNSSNALLYLSSEDSVADAASAMSFSMRHATYNALLVYFFREVRNTNAKILQHYVRKVITSLEMHHQVKSRHFPSSRIGLVVWPSFIVACEALDLDLRRRSIACIRHAVKAGFRNGEIAETVVREVWRQRDGGHSSVSWREIVQQSGVFMLLT